MAILERPVASVGIMATKRRTHCTYSIPSSNKDTPSANNYVIRECVLW